jgi:hypothetical protein
MITDTFVRIVQDLRATPAQDVAAPYVFSLRTPRLV